MGFTTFPSHRETTNTPARSIQEQGQVSGPGKTHFGVIRCCISWKARINHEGLGFIWTFTGKSQIHAVIAGDPVFRHTHLVKIIWVCLKIGDPQIWCVIIIFTMFNDQKLWHHQAFVDKDFSRTRPNPMSGGIESREPTFSPSWFLVISFLLY